MQPLYKKVKRFKGRYTACPPPSEEETLNTILTRSQAEEMEKVESVSSPDGTLIKAYESIRARYRSMGIPWLSDRKAKIAAARWLEFVKECREEAAK